METTLLIALVVILTCSYRTYEEWKPELSNLIKKEGKVLTVPMRNGNSKRLAQAKACGYSSYRTYEEWKHGWGDFVMDDFNFVLTVPMRNGNSLR